MGAASQIGMSGADNSAINYTNCIDKAMLWPKLKSSAILYTEMSLMDQFFLSNHNL
jgi:hypothetical protein